MGFTERLTAPATDDRHWIQTAYGGLNECIHIRGGSVLPNCVGYAWGRVYEITGKRPALSRNNAENWWGYTADGYDRGQSPKLGAVMCWAKGKAGVSSDGAGHVMVVERVNADGSVLASGSDYSGRRFYTRTFQPGYYLGSAYTFQGFIYASGEVSQYIEMEPVARDTAKDQITITSQVVNGRIYPGTASRSWGFLKTGTYDLYLDLGVEEKDGYKWYCVNPDYNGIGDRVWVAYSPDWAELHFAGESDPDDPQPEEGDKLVLDVSEFQTAIDWQAVKAAGIRRAVLRQGYRGWGSAGSIRQDAMLENHYAGASAAGLPVDLYFFSQATSEAEAREEAQTCIRWARGKQVDCIYMDIETSGGNPGRADGNSKQTWTAAALAFCAECQAAGYAAGVYANLSYMSGKLDTAALKAAGCRLWIAHYTDAAHPEYREQYDMWQYTSSGAVDGAEGRVDLSRQYTEPVKPEEETAMVILKIGPMSAGDFEAIKAKAQSLALPVQEPGDGTLIAGPMSAGDRRALEALAASLLLPVEVAEEAAPETPAQPECPSCAELQSRLDELSAQVADLLSRLKEAQNLNTNLKAECAVSKNENERLRELNGIYAQTISDIHSALAKIS